MKKKTKYSSKRARVVELKKRLLILGMILTVSLFLSITVIRFDNVNATNKEENPIYKYYTSYEIQSGDTLTSIAQKYTVNSNVSVQDYIDEVKKNNNLVSDKITSGHYLVISYYSDEYK